MTLNEARAQAKARSMDGCTVHVGVRLTHCKKTDAYYVKADDYCVSDFSDDATVESYTHGEERY